MARAGCGGEALGRCYADGHGLSVICLRFGSADLAYAIVYVVSDNRWGYRDLEHARR